MSVKNIILASVLAIVVLAAGSVIGCYFHYNNQEISLRQQSEAQRGKIEGVHDKMWKVLQQKAQVTDEYKSAFESIYPKLIPNFDVSLYKDLMQSIEIQRSEFQTSQERMLDIIREHETLVKTYPAKWFISDTKPIEYKVISSSKTKMIMQLGEDNDVDLFKK